MSEQSENTPELEARVKQLEAEHAAYIGECIQGLVRERKLLPTEAPRALARALADESYITELRLRQTIPEPEPVRPPITIAKPPGLPRGVCSIDLHFPRPALPEPVICDASAEDHAFNPS